MSERKFNESTWYNWEQAAVPLLLDLTFEACGEPFQRAFGLPFFTSILYYRFEDDSPDKPCLGSWLLRNDEGVALGRLLLDGLQFPLARKRFEDGFSQAGSDLLAAAAQLERPSGAPAGSEALEQELAAIDGFRAVFQRYYAIGSVTEPIQFYAEAVLRGELPAADAADLRGALFTMEEEPYSFAIERRLLGFAIDRKAGRLDQAAVADHAERYHWSANNYLRTLRVSSDRVLSEIEELASGDPAAELTERQAERRQALQRKAAAMQEVPPLVRTVCGLADQFGSTMADRRKETILRALAGLDAAARRVADLIEADYEDVSMFSPSELRSLAADPGRCGPEATSRRRAYLQTLSPYGLEDEEVSAALEFAEAEAVLVRSPEAGVAVGENAEQLLEQVHLRMDLFADHEPNRAIRGEVVQVPGQGELAGLVGNCRIVTDPFAQRDEFQNGEILVASSTTPDFVPIMRKALAVVTNMGGMLQHAAHFAREEKKPCIVGTGFATSAFKTGQKLHLDLATGQVTSQAEAGA